MLCPPRMISSLIRPVMKKAGRPSGPGRQKPSSPVWNQPPRNASAVASGRPAYSRMMIAPRTASSPRTSAGASSAGDRMQHRHLRVGDRAADAGEAEVSVPATALLVGESGHGGGDAGGLRQAVDVPDRDGEALLEVEGGLHQQRPRAAQHLGETVGGLAVAGEQELQQGRHQACGGRPLSGDVGPEALGAEPVGQDRGRAGVPGQQAGDDQGVGVVHRQHRVDPGRRSPSQRCWPGRPGRSAGCRPW